MDKNTNSKLITSYLPHGTGAPLIKLLKDETGICTGNVKNCRGTGSSAHKLNARDYDSWIEVDVLDVVVDADICAKREKVDLDIKSESFI